MVIIDDGRNAIFFDYVVVGAVEYSSAYDSIVVGSCALEGSVEAVATNIPLLSSFFLRSISTGRSTFFIVFDSFGRTVFCFFSSRF